MGGSCQDRTLVSKSSRCSPTTTSSCPSYCAHLAFPSPTSNLPQPPSLVIPRILSYPNIEGKIFNDLSDKHYHCVPNHLIVVRLISNYQFNSLSVSNLYIMSFHHLSVLHISLVGGTTVLLFDTLSLWQAPKVVDHITAC